ncbi:hypothetical protein BX600DRAFT_475667 [Xylariales sp. PMI_506]|nr:hypothetical protein BX600DRAFT_475667 [Xylariales sp. PMI_506]
MFPLFSWRHLPPLAMAVGNGLGALAPLWNPANAIMVWGLPQRIADSPPAQTCFILFSSRAVMFGLTLGTLYCRGQLDAVDTTLATLLYAAPIDAYLLWSQGEVGKAWFRGTLDLVFGIWGLLGLTTGGGGGLH